MLRNPRFGLLLLAIGPLLLLTGAIGLALTPATRETAAPTSSPEPTGSPTGEPTDEPAPPETAEAFVASFNRAQANSNVRFLVARLHPEVIERYGRAQCRAYLGEVAGTVRDVEIRRTSQLGEAEYATDGESVVVEDAYRLRISLTANGEPTTGQMTLGLVGTELRWFTDCGDPA
ncbi:MAG: hypothetical protein ACRDIX_06615 [Actinomycetota bacterium]